METKLHCKMHVLLIEDYLDLGELMVEVLADINVEAHWYVRVRTDTATGALYCMDADGKEHLPLSQSEQETRKFDCAIVDGYLRGSAMSGPEIVKAFKKKGLRVLASSGDPGLNRQMVSEGASASLEKMDLVTLVRKDPERLRSLFSGSSGTVK